jgi:hypothetical protein
MPLNDQGFSHTHIEKPQTHFYQAFPALLHSSQPKLQIYTQRLRSSHLNNKDLTKHTHKKLGYYFISILGTEFRHSSFATSEFQLFNSLGFN